jgi:hypothetical protein
MISTEKSRSSNVAGEFAVCHVKTLTLIAVELAVLWSLLADATSKVLLSHIEAKVATWSIEVTFGNTPLKVT